VKVRLLTAVDAAWSRQLLGELTELARADRFGVHELVPDAEEADVILFVDAHQYPSDWAMKLIRNHKLVRAYPEKAFVYDERDLPRDLLPGVFVSMPRKRFNPVRQRAFSYYRLVTDTRAARGREPDLLFSFQGRRTGPLRATVLAFSHPRAVVEDTSAHDFFADTPPAHLEAQRRYVDVVGRSKFVLCPHGAGTASIRLFEALAAGRVPVIISDDWVAPAGIDWSACSVRLAENELEAVGERLETMESNWPAMAEAARSIYDDWFAPDVWFHRVVELCGDILERGETGVARQWAQPQMWRAAARHMKDRAARMSR
jgi:hypothetical protein